jgi:hypothetical protein
MPAEFSRRRILTASAGALAASAGAAAGVAAADAAPGGGADRRVAPRSARPRRRPLDFARPGDSLRALVKLRGDLSGRTVLQWYSGTLNVALAGRPTHTVARYQGIIRTTWTPQPDGSFRYRTFDLGFFGDPETGAVVPRLRNPYTDAQVEPMDVRDGPIESLYTLNGVFRDGAPRDDRGTLSIPWRSAGDDVWYEANLAFERPNPLPPREFPRISASDTLFQRTLFRYQGRRSELEREPDTRAPLTTTQLVMSSPQPWLEMGAVPATQVIQTVSHKIDSIEQASPEIRDFIERTMPRYLQDETPFQGAGGSYERFRRERPGT